MDRTARRRLVEERKRRGWSQQALADSLGTTQHNVSRWETGHTTPSPYFRTKLDELFGISVQELLVPKSNAHPTDGHDSEGITQSMKGFKNNARQAALAGQWEGTVRHEEQGREYHLTLQFMPKGRTLRGAGQLHDAAQGEDHTIQSIIVSGRLLYERFLKLEYTLKEPPRSLQFGCTLLEFTVDGQALRGCFLGYGALVTRGIVTGTVYLQRQGAHEM